MRWTLSERGRLVFCSFLAVAVAWVLAYAPVQAAGLQASAARAFDSYARLAEARMDQERRGEAPFLWIDRLPDAERLDAASRIRQGQVLVSRPPATASGDALAFEDARCHHWVGTVFVPAPLRDVVRPMQGYERYPDVYRPAIRRARILSREGDHYRVFLQLFQKRVISVILNTESAVTYLTISSTRVQVRSVSTRIAEVRRADSPAEEELPAGSGQDHGFLWRFNNYCALDERDSGTFVQCETISLSRDVPFGLRWLIEPFVSSVPRESLEFTLGAMARAIAERRQN